MQNSTLEKRALLFVSLCAFALRVAPLIGKGGPLGLASDYDDGVYFSSSALLLRGVLPYRDFVFVHPPGILYFYALVSWLTHPAKAFAAARVLACIVGAINTFLVGRIVARRCGTFGAIVAAALYATFPDAVVAERSVYLEPVLNLACLASAWVWLDDRREQSRGTLAGVLNGAACGVKFLGGIWVIAALCSTRRGRFFADALRFIAAGAVTGVILLAIAFADIQGFARQTLWFQVVRPPDGTIDKIARVNEIAGSGHWVVTCFALIALICTLIRALRRAEISREERYFAVATLLTVAAFLASGSYWRNYNSYLAASACVLAGLGAATLASIPRIPRRALATLVAVLIAGAHFVTLRELWKSTRDRSPGLMIVGRAVRSAAKHDSVFAFDPTWLVAGDTLPPHRDGAPVIVDSYGAMLLHAVQSGTHYTDTGAAFREGPSQLAVRARLAKSRFAIIGWRGNWQLTANDRDWVAERFLCSTPELGDLCLWRRTEQLMPGLVVIPEGETVDFMSGWYDQEGSRPDLWRWMSSRGELRLHGGGHRKLQLYLHVPLESLRAKPTIVVTFDGSELGRLTPENSDPVLSFDVDAPGQSHQLTVSSDQTFRPSEHGSTDTRDLSLMLKRVVYVP